MGFKETWKKLSTETEGEKARKALRASKAEKKQSAYRAEKAVKDAEKALSRTPISEAGDRSTGVLACPKCGGTQFKAKRSAKGKTIGATVGVVTLGLAGPLAAAAAPKSRVRCVTCKSEYVRG